MNVFHLRSEPQTMDLPCLKVSGADYLGRDSARGRAARPIAIIRNPEGAPSKLRLGGDFD